jgi:hypothetical protein
VGLGLGLGQADAARTTTIDGATNVTHGAMVACVHLLLDVCIEPGYLIVDTTGLFHPTVSATNASTLHP